jgi:hypothetical protein
MQEFIDHVEAMKYISKEEKAHLIELASKATRIWHERGYQDGRAQANPPQPRGEQENS